MHQKIKKWRWALIILTIVVFGGLIFFFTRKGSPLSAYSMGTAEIGNIVEEVSVTGKVTPIREVSLALSQGGRIAFVGAKVGDKVSQGTILASIENTDVQAELTQVEISFETEKIKYDQLVRASKISGGTPDKNVSSNETILINARESLLLALKEGYAKIDNAESTYIDQFFDNPRSSPQFGITLSQSDTTYFIGGTSQEKIKINSEKSSVNALLLKWKNALDSGSTNVSTTETLAKNVIQKIDILVQEISTVLNSYNPDTTIEEGLYSGYKSDISSARTIFRAVSADINTASQSLVSKEAEVSPEELKIKELSLKSSEAKIQSIKSKLEETLVRAPFSGTVTSIEAKIGEIASPTIPLVRLISEGQFEIEAYVAESDISKVKIGDDTRVTLDAYGQDQEFPAKVSWVDPGETILEGVATYKVTFVFDKSDERIKSGMTANIDIRTGKRENVIRVPQRAVTQKDSLRFVKIVRDQNKIEEVEVKTGLRGSDGYIEIISGLNKGDKIVVFDKGSAK